MFSDTVATMTEQDVDEQHLFLRLRRLDEDDDEPSSFYVKFVQITAVVLVAAIAYVIYCGHCRRGKEEETAKRIGKAESDLRKKLVTITADNAIAKPTAANAGKASPYKLTISSPNNLAKVVFIYVRSAALADYSKKATCWSTFCLCICIFCLWLGFPMLISAFADTSEDGFMIPIVLLFFIIFPIVFIYLVKREYWQQLEPRKSAVALGKALDGRIVSNVKSSFLKSLEPLDEDTRMNSDGFLEITAFRNLQRAGYASVPSWGLYSAAMEHIISSVSDKKDEIQDIHNMWFQNVLPKASSVYASFTDGLDDTRRRAMRRAQGQLLDVATGGISGIVSAANDVNEMKEISKQLKDILKDIKDIKQISANASAVQKVLTGELVPHTGYHPLPSKRYKYGIGSMSAALLLIAITAFMIDHENSTTAGWLVLGLVLLCLVTGWYFAGKHNTSHNAVEDMIDVEIRTRKAIELAITGLLVDGGLSSGEIRDLIVATNDLRQTMMDNFYAALAIHAATEVMTLRAPQYGDDAPMLFPQNRSTGYDGAQQEQDGNQFPLKLNNSDNV